MHDPADCVRRLAGLLGVSGERQASFDWALIERDLGLALPADYKLVAECLPAGWVRLFARVGTPEVSAAWPGGRSFLDEFAEGEMATLREWRAEGGGGAFSVFPQPGRL